VIHASAPPADTPAPATLDPTPAHPDAPGGSGTGGGGRAGSTRWLRERLADPYSRSSNPLILNTLLTGVLGLGFWWLAPRYYSDADVGRGSALISVMTLLSGAVALNLTGTLSRFVPRTGTRTRRLVGSVYLLSCVVVALLATGFLLTLDHWGPTFTLLRDPVIAAWFVPVVVAAGMFTLQDAVLTALRNSAWVPVENTCFGILKIVLLVLLAGSFPGPGLYLAWVAAMVVLIPPINALIFTRLIPRHSRLATAHAAPPTRAQIGGFFAGDYVGAVFLYAATYLVPVIVAAGLAPSSFAHFYLVWTLVGILNLVGTNLATSVTVEGSYEAAQLITNCRAALRRAAVLLLLALAGAALFADPVLAALGPGYRSALPALLILACAALPRAVVEIWIGVLRAQGRTRQVARLQMIVGIVVVGSVLLWQHARSYAPGRGIDEITGVTGAVLVSYLVLAVGLVPRLRRFLTGSDGPRPGPPADLGTRLRRAHPPSRAVLVLGALSAAAVIGHLWSLREVDLSRLTGLGLVSVLPVTSLLSLAALALCFLITLSLPRPPARLLGAQVLATVCCLHGMTALIEPLPRFPTAWIHVGFVEYIGRTGTVLPDLDARFNWPGFFALVAFVTGKHDWPGLVGLMAWTPLAANLLYLLAFTMLLRNLRATTQARWFATWSFGVLNWVGQDYFSPQSLSYLFYLLFLAIVVTWFRRSGPDPLPTRDNAKTRELVPGELPPRPAPPGVRVSLLLLLVGLFTMVTFTHQITPFFMLSALTGLVLVRRCNTPGLPWLLGVILTAYVSYLASVYWAGHFSSLSSGFGNLLANLLAGTTDRTGHGSPEHSVVLITRLAITAGVFVLAAIGWRRRRRHDIDDRIALVLLLAPLPAVVEGYGGEMILRVYLFMLPGACVLAAYAFFPGTHRARRPARAQYAAAACGLILVGAFLFARFGNESYEITRPGELAATEAVYAHHGDTVLFLTENDRPEATPFIPLGYRDLDRLHWVNMRAPTDPRQVDGVVRELTKLGPGGYLMTTRSQEDYLASVADYRGNWGERFRARMRQIPQIRVVTENPDAIVFALRADALPPGPTVRHGLARGARVEPTPLSGVGLVCLIPLVVVLLVREVLQTRRRPGHHPWASPLTAIAVPLLLIFGVVFVERLIYLTVISPPSGARDSMCEMTGGQIGRGSETDMLRFQRPVSWCTLPSPFMGVWSQGKPQGF
jgi:O-antigen/teichoic acid export membrane protein